ncbi:MAG: uracil-DNA glycosylase [Pseudomonadota bacterium]|jgi:uracil-DNA glycosylase family 4|nr:uracil-DNA glycosylase [Hyphomicrobiales bacterium]MEC7890192.1 uracil-DNA glycosylase [Pseudomonadota bacterium]|tara:strand:- start:256 stop:894 length:639 start_codon:yes stop_codon:yes gene_type:complete
MNKLIEPNKNCSKCRRLYNFRKKNQSNNPDWFNAPVPTFGELSSSLLIVGLAPGLQGANKTGRPFTGDYAGDLLYKTINKFNFSKGKYAGTIDDSLKLKDCTITNAVRCVPPQNKPISEEINNCNNFLKKTIEIHKNLKVIIALGLIAHKSIISALNLKQKLYKFKHGNKHKIDNLILIDSYHCSRYNTNTGRLNQEMFEKIFFEAKKELKI